MTPHQLDHAILASVGPEWTKVAMVIARAVEAASQSDAGAPDDLNVFAERVKSLVAGGKLEGQGDLRDWRHSEVRKL
jgi:hypothetical protein